MICSHVITGDACTLTPPHTLSHSLSLDVDECAQPSSSPCHLLADCANTAGNFTCMCIDGLSGDGIQVCRNTVVLQAMLVLDASIEQVQSAYETYVNAIQQTVAQVCTRLSIATMSP